MSNDTDITNWAFNDCKMEMIDVDKILIDRHYERPLHNARVEYIKNNWNGKIYQPISVSHSEEGYFVVDGQHRHAAAKALGIKHLPCWVFMNLTLDQEAALFVEINKSQRPIKSSEEYEASLTGNVHTAKEIERILKKYGYAISSRTSPNRFNCYGAIKKLVVSQDGFELFEQCLMLLRECWSGLEKSTDSNLLIGLARFLATAKKVEHFNIHILEEQMKNCPPSQLLENNKLSKYAVKSFAAKMGFFTIYNKGCHGKDELEVKDFIIKREK